MSDFSVPCGRGSIPFTIDGQDAAELTTVTICVGLEEIDAATAAADLVRLAEGWALLGEGLRLAVALGAVLGQLTAWTDLPADVVQGLLTPSVA